MKETPNLTYIEQLADGQTALRERLLRVLKSEFPEEVQTYYRGVQKADFFQTAEIVHKLKHKFALLGLEKAYEMAVNYEEQLRKGSADLQSDFEDVLRIIDAFLKNLPV